VIVKNISGAFSLSLPYSINRSDVSLNKILGVHCSVGQFR